MTPSLRFQDVRAAAHGVGSVGPWSFQVDAGEAVALAMDPSLADTLTRLALGLVRPSAGTVTLLELEPWDLPRFDLMDLRRRVGVAFRREGLVSNLSLLQNLVLYLTFAGGMRPKEAESEALGILEELRLAHLAAARPANLTPEARVLQKPELLLLDSLISGLPEAQIVELLRWCRARCGSILVMVPGTNQAVSSMVDRWLHGLAGGEESSE